MLGRLFARQRLLHRQMGVGAFDSTVARMEYIRTMVLSAHVELTEVLNETGWKPWKLEGFGHIDKGRVTNELADVMLFVQSIAEACGVEARDLEAACFAKIDENERRQAEGY